MDDTQPMVTLGVRLDPSLRSEIDRIAQQEERRPSEVARRLLRAALRDRGLLIQEDHGQPYHTQQGGIA